jgi:hypothetical protein
MNRHGISDLLPYPWKRMSLSKAIGPSLSAIQKTAVIKPDLAVRNPSAFRSQREFNRIQLGSPRFCGQRRNSDLFGVVAHHGSA